MFQVGPIDNEATVFLERSQVDEETVKQISAMCKHQSIQCVRIMPDCHKGNGCCVGFTSRLSTSVIPGLIGGDIGCGISAHPLPSYLTSKKHSCERIDRVIQSSIPMGNGWDKVHKSPIISMEQYQSFYEEAQLEANEFVRSYFDKFSIDLSNNVPNYSDDWFRNNLCQRIMTDFNYDANCLGTLGGGNHFVEVNECDDGSTYLSVHTGSRNLGHKIAAFHHDRMMKTKRLIPPEALNECFISAVDSANNSQNKAIIDTVTDKESCEIFNEENRRRSNIAINDDDDVTDVDSTLEGLTGDAAALYFFDMIWAQTWAHMNRTAIISTVLTELGVPFDGSSIIESVHNYIDFRDLVIRKGSIAAREGQLCLIALNMRDGLLICRGRGNPDWNWSGPHGCGRLVSRRSAVAVTSGKNKIKAKKGRQNADVAAAMKKFEKEMIGVHSTCIVPGTLDERPSVYRDAAVIRGAISSTVDILQQARSILNVKGVP